MIMEVLAKILLSVCGGIAGYYIAATPFYIEKYLKMRREKDRDIRCRMFVNTVHIGDIYRQREEYVLDGEKAEVLRVTDKTIDHNGVVVFRVRYMDTLEEHFVRWVELYEYYERVFEIDDELL